MQEYVVGKVGDIPDGKGITIEAGRRTIAVFRIGSEFFAIHNNCPHKGASLCEGKVVPDKKVVRCPWHHWNWRRVLYNSIGYHNLHSGHKLFSF